MDWDKVLVLAGVQIFLFLCGLWFKERKFKARCMLDEQDKHERREFFHKSMEADRVFKSQLEDDAKEFLVGLKKIEFAEPLKTQPQPKKKK